VRFFCNRHTTQQNSKIPTYQLLSECSVHQAGLYVYNNEQKQASSTVIN